MAGAVVVRGDPERADLLAELAAVTEELAAARFELGDLERRLAGFTRAHDRVLAPLYAELDQVRARIARLLAERSGRADDLADAAAADRRARESGAEAEEADEDAEVPAPRRSPPGDRVRRLYRALVKLCHPDLAADEDDRRRRVAFTARVNEAYAADDADALADLTGEWGTGGGVPWHGDLRAAIEAARRRLAETRAEIERLRTTGLGSVLLGSDDPAAALERIADRVRAEIRRERDVLAVLR